MNWRRQLGIPDAKPEYRTTLANPTDELLDALTAGTRSDAGERVTQSSALGLATVFAAVERLSEAVGQLPLKVYRTMDDGMKIEAREHRSWRLLHDKPNPHTVAHTLWSTVTAQLLLGGNAYLQKNRTEGPDSPVDELWLMDPSLIEVELTTAGTKRFVDVSGGRRRVYGPEDILHIVGYSLNGLVGVSRIAYCRNTLGKTLARAKFEAEYYNQGGFFPVGIEYPGRLGETGISNLAKTMKAIHHGRGNRHKTPVLEEGATFKQLGMSLEDMQFVENAQLSFTEVAVLFGLPPAELGGMHGGSLEYSTEELNQIRFARAVAPLTNRIAKAVSADPEILPWNVMYAEFVLEAMMRPDAKSRVEYWGALKQMGVVDAAYIAARENLPPPPPEPVAPTPAANGNGDVTGNGVVDLADMFARSQRSRYSVSTGDQQPGVTFADGAIRIEAPPAPEVRVAPAQVRVETPPVEIVNAPPSKRRLTFSDGRTATLEEEHVDQ